MTVSMYGTKLYDAASGQELELTYLSTDHYRMYMGGASLGAFSPDGRRMITVFGHRAKVWDAASGHELFFIDDGNNYEISSVAFSPDSQRIVTGSADHMFKVWEAASGRLLFNIAGNSSAVVSVASLSGWPADCCRQFGWDGQAVGCSRRGGTAHNQGEKE